MSVLVEIAVIRRDEACQPRATTHLDLIEEYANALLDGAAFPPVTLFDDGVDYWLADGYHRVDAAEAACRAEILAEIKQGTRRDAILFSLGVNAAHGLRRTNEDKRRAVLTMLRDPEWVTWSDREIARRCAVDHDMVGRLRPSGGFRQMGRTRTVERGGTTYEMDTARIGNGSDAIPNAELWAAEQDRQQLRRNEPDQTNAYLIHAMRAVLDAIEQMPAPAEAAASYPNWAEHDLSAAQVSLAATWLFQFAGIWAETEPTRNQRTQAMVERIRLIKETLHVAS